MVSILDYYSLKACDGTYGIEVEMEGVNLPFIEVGGWRSDHDGSLKGKAYEYVMKKPVKENKVDEKLEFLHQKFLESKARLNPSIRCGVHVHLNIQDRTHTQLATLVCLYYVVEELLLRYCGTNRVGNLFCLGVSHAPAVVSDVVHAFDMKNLRHLCTDAIRYSALNLKPVTGYGSVEFRSLATPADPREIKQWVDIIEELNKASYKFDNPRELMGEFSMNTPEEFLKAIFPDNYDLLTKDVNNIGLVLRTGMRHAQIIAFEVDWDALEAYLEDEYKKHLKRLKDRDAMMAKRREADEREEIFVGQPIAQADVNRFVAEAKARMVRMGNPVPPQPIQVIIGDDEEVFLAEDQEGVEF